jgi:hypothetical protein
LVVARNLFLEAAHEAQQQGSSPRRRTWPWRR